MALNGIYILPQDNFDLIYGPGERKSIADMANMRGPFNAGEIRDDLSILADIDIIFSGWGGPTLDAAFLDAAPALKAVFYGAGSVRGIVTDEFWKRDIVICSSWAANAVPVAEFCVSQILFCLKLGWQYVRRVTTMQGEGWKHSVPVPGAYGSRIGLVSLGMIGRKTLELLHPYNLSISVYSTSLTRQEAGELNVNPATLDGVFETSDVVSLHTANVPATRGMITGDHFARMKQNASFINTARGAVVREDEMISALKDRPDITAVLDVTDPEPPAQGSPLYSLPNVVLTPHIAGSMNGECHRMARYAADELHRYLCDQPLRWRLTKEQADRLA